MSVIMIYVTGCSMKYMILSLTKDNFFSFVSTSTSRIESINDYSPILSFYSVPPTSSSFGAITEAFREAASPRFENK
jgi:hypothetical protein